MLPEAARRFFCFDWPHVSRLGRPSRTPGGSRLECRTRDRLVLYWQVPGFVFSLLAGSGS
jgi:hypothetical protein